MVVERTKSQNHIATSAVAMTTSASSQASLKPRNSVLFQYTVVGLTVPKSVTCVTVDPSVKHIPDNAFRECTRLVEV
jgi:hypothetical protein